MYAYTCTPAHLSPLSSPLSACEGYEDKARKDTVSYTNTHSHSPGSGGGTHTQNLSLSHTPTPTPNNIHPHTRTHAHTCTGTVTASHAHTLSLSYLSLWRPAERLREDVARREAHTSHIAEEDLSVCGLLTVGSSVALVLWFDRWWECEVRG